MNILAYDFMQRALLAGIMTALLISTIGVFVVLRRMALVGDSIAHSALAGVAFGMLFGIYPFYGAVVFSVLAAISIEIIRRYFHQYQEVALAVVMSASMGLAAVLISLGKSFGSGIMSYLFGSLMAVSAADVKIIFIIGVLILISIIFLHRELFSITFDEEAARLLGISVDRINFYFTILTALAISVSIRVVGALLVSALMVIPTATGIIAAKSFRQVFGISTLVSALSVILGLYLSFIFDLAPGGTIVILASAILGTVILAKTYKRA